MSPPRDRIVIATQLTPKPALAVDAAIVFVHVLFLAVGFLSLLR